ncbi:MAG: aldo/keto reductase [Firmicutes bacterium]|nr:aldo/keto reductase [Bacillota bacterium]
MKKRTLGKTSMEISAVGLGCMGFSHAYGDPTEKDVAVRMIRKAYDMGYTFFDTAECYTGINADGSISYNEALVGEALRDVRDKVVIATKMGITFTPNGSVLDSSPAKIRASVEGSLKKLGTDYIDLYYQHRIDPKVEPEVVAKTMGELIKEGKIRAWGISETGEEYLRRANAVTPVTAIQNRYSMIAREYEKLFPVLEELGVSLVAFSPLGNGFLSGKYSATDSFKEGVDFRSHMPQYTKEGFEAGRELFELLGRMAEEKGASTGQLSLAWMLSKKPYIIPSPGSRKEERLLENLNSRDVLLSQEEIAKLDALLDQLNMPVYGKR